MFKKLEDQYWVSPQMTLDDVAEAATQGVRVIVNNRPDGEAPDAPQAAAMEAAVRAAGLDYVNLPVASGFSMPQIDTLVETIQRTDGPILAYCASGNRSTLLWALAQVMQGKDAETLSDQAMAWGYNLAPIRPTMDALARKVSDAGQ